MFANSNAITALAFTVLVLQLIWWGLLFRRPKKRTDSAWVLYATQTGSSQQLAEQTAKQLTTPNKAWSAINLRDWLAQYEITSLNYTTTLFVVSTQGEGDPPDNAVAFFHKLQTWNSSLSKLKFAVLGLGDSRYTHFCGFSHNLQQQLIHRGASVLFNVVTVDNLNTDDIGVWHRHLAKHFELANDLSPIQELPSSATATATLIHRHCENADSPAMSLFSLRFRLATQLTWQAGDIADVSIPTNNGEVLRQYSIANVVTGDWADSEQMLSLLIRQVSKDNGELGVGSGYLTDTLSVGEIIALSIRHNPNFHLPESPVPLLLIATGSGLAGILALLQQAEKVWGTEIAHHLIYGERYPDYDTPCREVLTRYQASGLLRQIDYCFSRGEDNYRYVQDALIAQSETIKTAIQCGAMVYVCGSKTALGESIPNALKQCLSEADYQRFIDSDSLRLDVY